MKNLIILLLLIGLLVNNSFSQSNFNVLQDELPLVQISKDLTVHFISPENIQYVDISTNAIAGDLPVKNILRIKLLADSAYKFSSGSANAVLTLAGESFIAQYHLSIVSGGGNQSLPSQVNILPEHIKPLNFPGITLASQDFKDLSLGILKSPDRSLIRSARGAGLKVVLNHIYAMGDYIFLDISYLNRTNLPYDIDEQRFRIEDKKINKATNSQSIEIQPLWKLYSSGYFRKQYRNIYVLKKLTIPGNKILSVELAEKQLSGRTISLTIPYRDILNADTF